MQKRLSSVRAQVNTSGPSHYQQFSNIMRKRRQFQVTQ